MTMSDDNTYGVAAGELRQIVEVREQLEAEKAQKNDEIKAHMADAKARGFDVKAINKIISLRKRNKDDISEEEAILDMYKSALGME